MSTATVRITQATGTRPDPRMALTPQLSFADEPVYWPAAPSPPRVGWFATVQGIESSFADLVAVEVVAASPVQSILDDNAFAECWKVFSLRARRVEIAEDDAEPVTGIFAPSFERDVKFRFDVQLSRLEPRSWEPHITLLSDDTDPEDE